MQFVIPKVVNLSRCVIMALVMKIVSRKMVRGFGSAFA